MLAKLLKEYTDYDIYGNRIRAIAFFFLYYLKLNGLTSSSNNYLSSTSYLMILYNYYQ
jgi:hypothetical protein